MGTSDMRRIERASMPRASRRNGLLSAKEDRVLPTKAARTMGKAQNLLRRRGRRELAAHTRQVASAREFDAQSRKRGGLFRPASAAWSTGRSSCPVGRHRRRRHRRLLRARAFACRHHPGLFPIARPTCRGLFHRGELVANRGMTAAQAVVGLHESRRTSPKGRFRRHRDRRFFFPFRGLDPIRAWRAPLCTKNCGLTQARPGWLRPLPKAAGKDNLLPRSLVGPSQRQGPGVPHGFLARGRYLQGSRSLEMFISQPRLLNGSGALWRRRAARGATFNKSCGRDVDPVGGGAACRPLLVGWRRRGCRRSRSIRRRPRRARQSGSWAAMRSDQGVLSTTARWPRAMSAWPPRASAFWTGSEHYGRPGPW